MRRQLSPSLARGRRFGSNGEAPALPLAGEGAEEGKAFRWGRGTKYIVSTTTDRGVEPSTSFLLLPVGAWNQVHRFYYYRWGRGTKYIVSTTTDRGVEPSTSFLLLPI